MVGVEDIPGGRIVFILFFKSYGSAVHYMHFQARGGQDTDLGV